MEEEKRLQQLFSAPLDESEKCGITTQAEVNSFFARKATTTTTTTNTTTPPMTTQKRAARPKPEDFAHEVEMKVTDVEFQRKHSESGAPLAIVALADYVSEQMIKKNDDVLLKHYFHEATMVIPKSTNTNPHYHSIVGQKLLYVDWGRTFGVTVQCPCCGKGMTKDRTNFSKNKVLFPIFTLDGPPMWCIVMVMTCDPCNIRVKSNDSRVLCMLPPHVANSHPVDYRHALAKKSCHLARNATNVFDNLMTTYGNGEICSRLLYDVINRDYILRLASCCSYLGLQQSTEKPSEHPIRDGEFIATHPPLGDSIRDAYNEAANNSCNPWRVSDNNRHTREIQAVGSRLIFAQDHTHEVVKNCRKKKIGAVALLDCSTETGEIASAVLVPSTKTSDFAHAAQALARRPNFNPKAMYSDTWPCMSAYWPRLFGKLEGRLGLFHYIQRISKTLRKRHIDWMEANNRLLDCMCTWHEKDLENLLKTLKEGTMSPKGKKYSDDEVGELQNTGLFRRRYNKYLRKQIRPPETMRQLLDNWFCKYKVEASEGSRPAEGRRCPDSHLTLFTSDTKTAVENCKDKANHLGDPLDLEDMHFAVPAHPESKHKLNTYLSKRGESKLEQFHDTLAHFANCGMRESLADALNLCGTARHNVGVRHRLSLALTTENPVSRRCPAGFEDTVPYFNHSELNFVNELALRANCRKPFPQAEPLPADNGERFFSQYLIGHKNRPKSSLTEECLCSTCRTAKCADNETKQDRQMDECLLSPNRHTYGEDESVEENREEATTQINNPRQLSPPPIPLQPQQPMQHTVSTAPRPQQHVDITTNNTIHHHHHSFGSAPTAPQPIFAYQQYQWMMMMNAAMTANPFNTIQQPQLQYQLPACRCERYMAWQQRAGRKGRPPRHESWCHLASGAR